MENSKIKKMEWELFLLKLRVNTSYGIISDYQDILNQRVVLKHKIKREKIRLQRSQKIKRIINYEN